VGRKDQYTEEFRTEAVRLWVDSGLSFNQVASDLGIPAPTLRSWVRATHPPRSAHLPRTSTGGPLTDDERAELVELRHRVRVLQHEKDILRKAAAFFAQESERTR
jgi:transposase